MDELKALLEIPAIRDLLTQQREAAATAKAERLLAIEEERKQIEARRDLDLQQYAPTVAAAERDRSEKREVHYAANRAVDAALKTRSEIIARAGSELHALEMERRRLQ